MFKPNLTITSKIMNTLLKIEALKENIKNLPITPGVMRVLYETARLSSVHFSTRIEGNRLTQKEIEIIINEGGHFAGRERDEREIKGYFTALEWMEDNTGRPLTETTIKTLHALVEGGGKRRVKPTPYRDGQNAVKDSLSGRIVYMPPEAPDVPALMKDMVKWINSEDTELPCPIISAVAHYQFVTIHPYYDGNGRTARLLATLILHRGGYDLKGLYSLEEYYARDLPAYYNALSRGGSHNYYYGGAEADITPWVEYFTEGMLDAFEHVKLRAYEASLQGAEDRSSRLRNLSPRQRKILTLFETRETITSKEVANLFRFGDRSARSFCRSLVEEGILVIFNSANKTRSYRLAENLFQQ